MDNRLRTNFPNQIIDIKYQYECLWKQHKLDNRLQMEAFWFSTKLPQNRPLNRLIPRVTLRGGFIEQYRLKFTEIENPGWKIYFADVNSLYSHIAMTNVFPLGKYQILLSKDNLKDNITFVNGQFFYKGQSMQGDAAHVKLLAPARLFRPFLGYRVNDEFNFLGLCKMCMIEKRAVHCTHKAENSRYFTSCYQVTDLAKAVELGYEILEWYELHHYTEHDLILKDFIQILGAQKLRHSDIYSNMTEAKRTETADYINKAMSLTGNLQVTESSLNLAQKQLFKDMMNSFFGRFALHTNYTHHYFCRNLFEIQKHAQKSNAEIKDILAITEDTCQLEVSEPSKIKPSQNGCLYITSEINALARKFIYEKSELIDKANGIVIAIDTDSIIYALPPDQADVLTYSSAFGDFKHVLGFDSTIKSVYSLGPRNYSITYLDKNGCENHMLKVKGLSTTSINNCDTITPNIYQEFLEKRFEDEFTSIYLPQMRKKFEKQTYKFHEILTKFNFGNEIHTKRFVVNKDSSYTTYPYGYKWCKKY